MVSMAYALIRNMNLVTAGTYGTLADQRIRIQPASHGVRLQAHAQRVRTYALTEILIR